MGIILAALIISDALLLADSMSVKAATHGEDHGGLDAINGRWGRGKMRLASVSPDPDWGMRREMMSLSFTTRLDRFGRFIANELSFAIRHA